MPGEQYANTLSPVNQEEKRNKCIQSDGDECEDNNSEKTEKLKGKARKKREMGDLEENRILPTRLRSDSGKVYSSSVLIDKQNIEAIKDIALSTVEEESEIEMAPQNDSKFNKLINMITKLQESVDGIKGEISGQQCVTANLRNYIEEVEEKSDNNSQEIHNLKVELKEQRFHRRLIENVVIRQEEKIATLSRKMTEMQQREMNANIVISGMEEMPNENPIQTFNDFVQNKLELQELLPARQAFRLGSGKNRPMIIELRHPETDKRKIFQQASKLKGKTNKRGTPYFISDHLPEELNENRRRINDILTTNRKLPKEKKSSIEIQKGKLLVNKKPYKNKIATPSLKELFKQDEDTLDLADEIDLVKGKDKTEKNSHFVAYAGAIKDEKDVNAAYLKVKTKFADASHVVCAYRAGSYKESPENQDYVDDGEFGAGRTILRVLKEEQMKNIVIFMV